MNEVFEKKIIEAIAIIAARYIVAGGRTHDCIYHGQGLFELGEYEVLAELKAVVQEIDYRLIVTSMIFLPNGNLLVNFDRFI